MSTYTKGIVDPKWYFKSMGEYMKFYEAWVRTCCRLNRKSGNPNIILMRRYMQ